MMKNSVLLGLAGATLLLWIPMSLRIARGVRAIGVLRDLPEPAPHASLPGVSVVVAARDEADAIEDAVDALLSQDYPDVSVVAVDDRSSDGTGVILDRLAARDPRVRVIHVETLADGWLGKNHALHQGARGAPGELLLFTDGDVILERTALSRAVAKLERDGLDHLAVAPDVRVPGFWGRAFVGFFAMAFSMYARPWEARDPRSQRHVGIGAFNLVRARAYHAVGGHARLRMRPDDDMMLGKVLKQAGFRQDIAFGWDLVRVDWYPGVRAMIRGLEKNSFAAVEYSMPATLAACAAVLALNVWPWIALVATGGTTRRLNAGVVGCIFVAWVGNGHAPATRLRDFVAYPVVATLFTYTILRAAVLALRQGGIRWRDTHYPLAALRENRV